MNKRPVAAEEGLLNGYRALPLSSCGGKRLFVLPYSGFFEAGLMREQDCVYCFSGEIVNHVRSVVGFGNYLIGDGYRLPIADASVDEVLWLDTIGHLPTAELLLQEIARVLKPDGSLLISFSNRNSVFGLAYDLYNFKLGNTILNTYLWRIGPERKFHIGEIRRLVSDCGLGIYAEYGLSIGKYQGFPAKWRLVVWLHNVFERLMPVLFSEVIAMSVRKPLQF